MPLRAASTVSRRRSASRSVVACSVALEEPAAGAPRIVPTSRRIAASDSTPLRSISSNARNATSGLSEATTRAACACTTIPVTWWATTSCSSRARAIRSACCAADTSWLTEWRRSLSRLLK